jgi:hypothetical protein
MATLMHVTEALLASREHDSGAVGRFKFWTEQFGAREIGTITADDVDAALVCLAERGRLKAGRGRASTAVLTGKPLSGATINRYVSSLASVYKFARQIRLLSRACIAHPGRREGP